MQLSLYQWDGYNINDGTNFIASIPPGQTMPAATPEYVNRGNIWPLLAGKSLNGATLTIKIIFKGTIHSQLETLKGLFRTDDFELRTLTAKDTADSDRIWYVEGFPIQPPSFTSSEGSAAVFVTLALKNPYWKEYTLQSDTWNIVASGATRAITARGNYRNAPTFKITPTSMKAGGFAYKRYVIVRNPIDRPYQNYPLDISGAWNTAALVSGGKMQADGDDLRVVVDGQETNRWFGGGGINSTTTRVFINLSLKSRIEFTIGANISNSGVADISVKKTEANIKALKELPSTGFLLVDNEVIEYEAVNVAKRLITPKARGTMQTSAAAHTAGATAKWIEHVILVQYGNPSAETPEVDDTVKPLLDLSQSTNTYWRITEFADIADAKRTARWKPARLKSAGGASYPYYGDKGSITDDPAIEAGALIGSYKRGGVWRNGQGSIAWNFYNPAGFVDVAGSGEKYRKLNSWPTAAIQKSKNGTDWSNVVTQATPGSANTWTAFGIGTTAFGTGFWPHVRLLFSGSVSAGADAYSAVEYETLAFNLESTRVPSVIFQTELNNYYAEFRVTNTTTGEYFTVACVMGLNETITVDCDNLRIYNSDGQHLHGALELSSKRPDFLTLAAGSNTIQFDETGLAAITVVTEWRGWNLV